MKNIKQKDQSTNIDKKKAKKPFSLPLTAAGVVLLLVLSPWLLFLNSYQPEQIDTAELEFDHYIQETIDNIKNFIVSNATRLLEQNSEYNTNMTKFEERLYSNVDWILATEYQPYVVPDKRIEVSIDYYSLDIEPEFRSTNDLIRYPGMADGAVNKLETSTLGFYSDTSVPYSYLLTVNLQLAARQFKEGNGNGDSGGNGNDDQDKDKWDWRSRSITFEEILAIPHLFIEYKLQQFQNQGETACSDLARMMRYMLTTLARIRSYNIDGSTQITDNNIINEGDIELILNLAIILEEALLFRAYDPAAVDSVDEYFFDASNSKVQNNPTRIRQWKTAEINNYDDYLTRRGWVQKQSDRLLSTLISKYKTSGLIDPADLMALYLVLDNSGEPAIIGSPKDVTAVLEEDYETRNLMDPRTPEDAVDTTNLKFILSLPESNENDFNLKSVQDESELEHNIELLVDQQPNYLVYGADFRVNGLDEPRGWYSTAPLRETGRTRTPSIIKVPPEDKNYRLEWKLNLKGEFKLNLKTLDRSILLNIKDLGQTLTIDLDLPLNIYVWFKGNPQIPTVDFLNLNTGGAQTNGTWLITTESHLVEYFGQVFWKYIKPIATLVFDSINSVLPYVLAHQGFEYYFGGKKKYLDHILSGNDPITSNWLADILLYQAENLDEIIEQNLETFWLKFDVFMADYFLDYYDQYGEEYGLYELTTKPQFPHQPLLPWISALGYEVTLFYNKDTQVMNITIEHPNGYISIFISGYNQTSDEFGIVVKNHIEVPGLINLDTIVNRYSQSIGVSTAKPEISASGLLFNKYKVNTKAYNKLNIISPTNLPKSNEQLLFTRSKFGPMVTAASLEIPQLFLNSNLQDVSMTLTFKVPEGEQNQEQLQALASINSWGTDPDIIDTDSYLENRIYLLQLFKKLSENLTTWYGNIGGNLKLALDFALLSNNARDIQDFTNITFYLTESQSFQNFIDWLGNYGLELILEMGNEDTILTNVVRLLTQENQYFDLRDLENIDIELYNRVLDNKVQKEMSVSSNILSQYQYPKSAEQNLTLLIVVPGPALVAIANGLEMPGKYDGDGNRATFTQVFYCYQPQDGLEGNTPIYLLSGTDYLINDL